MITAFSRETDDKVYVQHRLRQSADKVHSLLLQGASVYVCGDAACMAKDVDRVLAEILAGGRGVGYKWGETALKEMRATGRYQVLFSSVLPLSPLFSIYVC